MSTDTRNSCRKRYGVTGVATPVCRNQGLPGHYSYARVLYSETKVEEVVRSFRSISFKSDRYHPTSKKFLARENELQTILSYKSEKPNTIHIVPNKENKLT